MSKNDYPKMLYREGGEIEWEGRSLDTLVVNDEKEEAAAGKEGFKASVPRAKAD